MILSIALRWMPFSPTAMVAALKKGVMGDPGGAIMEDSLSWLRSSDHTCE